MFVVYLVPRRGRNPPSTRPPYHVVSRGGTGTLKIRFLWVLGDDWTKVVFFPFFYKKKTVNDL